MKILFFTDTHIRGNNPKNRKDDFILSLENKFLEIKDIIDDENIDFILHGGDLFERPDTSMSIVNRFTKIINDFKLPIYLISGNHDIYGHNPTTVNRTILSVLDTIDLIHLVEADQFIVLEKDGLKVQLTGQPYIYDIDTPDKIDYYYPDKILDDMDYSIHMVHGMLLDKPFIKGVNYTLVDDIKDTPADITLAGHYHRGFETIEYEGKYFINPGSLVRISNSVLEINRKPKLIILELTKENIEVKEVFLKNVLKGSDVLDRTVIENSSFKAERIYEFKQTIDSSINFEKLDINDIIIEFSSNQDIEEDVLKEALNRISKIQMKEMS